MPDFLLKPRRARADSRIEAALIRLRGLAKVVHVGRGASLAASAARLAGPEPDREKKVQRAPLLAGSSNWKRHPEIANREMEVQILCLP